MKTIFSFLSAGILLLVSLVACAEGMTITPSKNYVTKKVNVGSFDGISTSSAVSVIYTQTSGTQDIEIYAPENFMEYVNVRVSNGTLKAGMDNKSGFNFNGKYKVEVRVSAGAVKMLEATSAGNILLKNGLNTSENVNINVNSAGDVNGENLTCDNLYIDASSAADIELTRVDCKDLTVNASSAADIDIKELSCENVSAESSSSADINLAGSCQRASLNASSGSDLDAEGLKAVDVSASASSGADVDCYASGSLKKNSSSGGSVSYKGNPKQSGN